MSPPPMNRELRMLSPAQRPTRITPLFQDRKSKRLTISIPESVAWLETPSWCQVEQHLLSPDLNAEFETFYIELPQATTCESLNSFCPRGENLESPAGTPRSKDPPGEWSDSTGSLRVFGSEVVESSSFLGGDAMEEDDQEGGPPTNTTEEDSSLYNQFLQDLPAGTAAVTAGALLDMPAGMQAATTGMDAPPTLTFGDPFQQAGRFPTVHDVAAAPTWRNPYTPTMRREELAPGVPVSQGPFPVHPPALPASLPPLGRDFFQLELLIPQTQRQRGGSQLTHQTNFDNILTTLWNDADPTANLGVNPPVTYDLGGVTPSGAGPDRGPRPSPEMLFEDWARPRIAPGGSLPSLPRIPFEPPAPTQLAPPRRPHESAAFLSFPPSEPFRHVPTPESALTSLALRNFETLRERLLADVLGTLPELMQRVSVPLGPRVAERLADASDPTGGIPGFPQGFLQRVASAPPLGVANLPTLVAPTDPALESPRMVSTVQLASSEGSPAATSSPAKRPRKRPTSKGKATEGQLEKAPSVKRRPARPLSPMPNPLTNPEDDPPQSAPQNPGGGQGAAADPSSMGPNRTFSEWSEEPAAEVGGQGTRRPLKKPHDVPPPGGTLSAHSSGGGSAAGSLSETAAPIKGEGPKERDEGFTRNRAQNRQDRIKRLNELRKKPCGCTQDWPNDMQELRAACNQQSLEIRSLQLQLGMMNRRDSLQTQDLEELRRAVTDLTRALAAARAQLARQGPVAVPGEGPEPRPAEGARGPAEARPLEGSRARGAQPQGEAQRGGRGGRSSEEDSSRGPRW